MTTSVPQMSQRSYTTSKQARHLLQRDMSSDDDDESENENTNVGFNWKFDPSNNFSDASSSDENSESPGPSRGPKFVARTSSVDSDEEDDLIEDREQCQWEQVAEFDTETKPGTTRNDSPFTPTREPGLHANLDASSSALDCWFSLLTPDVLCYLIRTTNLYVDEKKANCPSSKKSTLFDLKPINEHELLKFLAVITAMGLSKRTSIKDYWAQAPHFYTPWFSELFSRSRFELIYHTIMQTTDVASEGKDKIEPFLNLLISKFQDAFYPFQDLAIDEMIIGYSGRWKHKKCNSSKPNKYQIKTFGLCDSITGYVYSVFTYFGKNSSYILDNDPTASQAVMVFDSLLQGIGKGHHIFADSYYTVDTLMKYLLNRGIHYTGAVSTNNIPHQLETISLQNREARWYRNSDGSQICVAWQDKLTENPSIVVSTETFAEMMHSTTQCHNITEKPKPIQRYNVAMNRCDHRDQMISYYCNFNRRSRKWPKKLFFWIIEVSQVNAHILYTLSHPEEKPISLKSFKSKLIDQLTKKAASIVPPELVATNSKPGRKFREGNKIKRFEGAKHVVDYINRDRNCAVCSTPAKRARTNFYCIGCPEKPHLHPKNCFRLYHTHGLSDSKTEDECTIKKV